MEQIKNFENLPDELKVNIIHNLSPDELFNIMGNTSKHNLELIKSEMKYYFKKEIIKLHTINAIEWNNDPLIALLKADKLLYRNINATVTGNIKRINGNIYFNGPFIIKGTYTNHDDEVDNFEVRGHFKNGHIDGLHEIFWPSYGLNLKRYYLYGYEKWSLYVKNFANELDINIFREQEIVFEGYYRSINSYHNITDMPNLLDHSSILSSIIPFIDSLLENRNSDYILKLSRTYDYVTKIFYSYTLMDETNQYEKIIAIGTIDPDDVRFTNFNVIRNNEIYEYRELSTSITHSNMRILISP